jgi:UDP-galactopyranose mutase
MEFDYLIAGSGLSGMVLAERLCTQQNKKVLMVDKRPHIGGNCYDVRDSKHRITIHKYGPHYFRTNSDRVIEYLNQFTEWKMIDFKVATYTDGKLWQIPINLNTFEMYIGKESTSEEFKQYLDDNIFLIEEPRNLEELITSKIGMDLYEKFYKNYLIKKWGKNPEELDVNMCDELIYHLDRNDNYFDKKFQGIPKTGYTRMFEEMIKKCGANLIVLLNTDYFDIKDTIKTKHTIYSGPIDKYYNYIYGVLPYRSLRFKEETYRVKKYQPYVQVNYPNTEEYTRIVEMKHLTSGIKSKTVILKEYPQKHTPNNEPYHPILTDDNISTYNCYKELSNNDSSVTFIGRLATFIPISMDEAVELALDEFDKLKELNP